MKLSELARGLPGLSGDLGADPEVSGVRHDSRRIARGDLFVAWKGERHDGARFAADAVDRGAVAVVCDGPHPEGWTAEEDRDHKGIAYESDPLFLYLWNRGFGTPAYASGGIIRLHALYEANRRRQAVGVGVVGGH